MKWLGRLFRKRKLEEQMDSELRFHVEQKTAELIASGVEPGEARRHAMAKLGGIEAIKEEWRESRATFFLESLLQDIRYAVRMLGKNRGATAVATISLAIAIGPNVVLFSVVHRALLAPRSAFAAKAANVYLLSLRANRPGIYAGVSYPDLLDFRAQAGAVASFAGSEKGGVVLNRRGRITRLQGRYVTWNYFSIWGLRAAAGRTFEESDAHLAGAPPVVISYSLARREFGAAARAVGQTMMLCGEARTVIGVAPSGFHLGLLPNDVWVPFSALPRPASDRGTPIEVDLRLRAGVSRAHAEAVLSMVARRLAKEYPVTDKGATAELLPAADMGPNSLLAPIILSLAGLVIFVACANIIGILLAQGEARRHEFALRAAMGATRGRLVRQLSVESLLLSALGAALGLLLAFWLVPAASAFQPMPLVPMDFGFRLDGTTLAYTLLLMVVAAFAAGLLPALRLSRTDPATGLKSNAPATGHKSQFRGVLVIAQIAFWTFFLVGAGLLLRSYFEAQNIRPGFDPDGNVLVGLLAIPPNSRMPDYSQLAGKLRAIPGVGEVSLADPLPLSGAGPDNIRVSTPGGTPVEVWSETAGPHYFSIMGTPLLRGRDFERGMRPTRPW